MYQNNYEIVFTTSEYPKQSENQAITFEEVLHIFLFPNHYGDDRTAGLLLSILFSDQFTKMFAQMDMGLLAHCEKLKCYTVNEDLPTEFTIIIPTPDGYEALLEDIIQKAGMELHDFEEVP